MTNFQQRFIPLNIGSQNTIGNVLYYDSLASLDNLYDCITGRLDAVINLLEQLQNYNDSPPPALQAVAAVSSILLNDVYSVLSQFTPSALKSNHIATGGKG